MNSENNQKPISPHLQIYKWNISSFTSILHRFTGVVLYSSIVAICWYIVYYTYSINIQEQSESCECWFGAIFKIIIIVATFGLTFSLYYHFCNGIRHLFWDIGKGFELKTAKINGYLVLLISTILTISTFLLIVYLKLY